MKRTLHLLCGNHPKSHSVGERIVKIIKMLKQSPQRQLPIEAFEKEFGIDKVKDSTKFYRPFKLMRDWHLLRSHRKAVFDGRGKKHFETTYELTPKEYVRYIKETLADVCRTEIDMV